MDQTIGSIGFDRYCAWFENKREKKIVESKRKLKMLYVEKIIKQIGQEETRWKSTRRSTVAGKLLTEVQSSQNASVSLGLCHTKLILINIE